MIMVNKVKQELFSTPIWTHNLENTEKLNQDLIKEAGKYKFGEDYFSIKSDAIQELKSRILPIIKEVVDECGFSSEKMHITGRQNPKFPGECDSPHHHPECMLSILYYVSIPPKSGDLLLHDPRGPVTWKDPEARTDVSWKSYRMFHRITPKEGSLLFFPSYLIHSVETNLSNEMRLSIAITPHNIYEI